MAEIFPDEGLDLILNIFPKGGTNLGIAGQYLGLWTAFTASTVGSSGQTRSSYTEATFTNYARVAMSSWGSPAAGTGGRKVVGNQVTFPTAGATPGSAINGFGLYDASTLGTLIFAANFDDTTAVTMGNGDVIKVTPTCQFNN